ncbi:MAG: hypothetical protein Q8P05_00510 [Candidatus Diapherotrites archaeon]|nr:hypothetical protein [Candidatus Diapherotrites archaeon]MDZ4256478.1 hypothetical protein [archaeon]
MRKGQLYSSDALLAITIFLFALTMIALLSSQLEQQAVDQILRFQSARRAEGVAQALFGSPGNPVYWDHLSDRNGITSVGLIENGMQISSSKWAALRDWNGDDYPSLKTALRIPDVNFYITLQDTNRQTLSQAGTAPVDVNQVNVIVIPTVYAGENVVAILQVWGE